jgi:cystathionine beta-lyase/cystathionine gamma-synthase
VTGQLRQFEFRLNLRSGSRLGVFPAALLFLDMDCLKAKEIALSTQDLNDFTVAIHGGRTLDSHASSILFPLYQTSTFVHDAVGVDKGFSYSRVSNPTVDALEKAIGALEHTPPAVCFRAGMAAITTLFLSLLKSGDHAIISDVVYGGTMRLFREVLDHLGIAASFVDTSHAANVEAAITPATRIVFIETPGNPTLKLTDIAAVAQIAQRHSILLAVDNTFLTPILQKPLELGADISVLSTTKYIDGHNASVGGSLATRDEKLLERFRLIRKTIGATQAPFEAWLTLQGMKTLPARLKLHCEGATIIAHWLERHPAVEHVYYPGLDSFPQKALAEKQQRAFGGMISFELKSGYEAAVKALNSVQLCSRAESLGSLETLITHPSSTTHSDVEPELRRRLGITDGLVRLSVGLEAPEDIIADLEQAFAAAGC